LAEAALGIGFDVSIRYRWVKTGGYKPEVPGFEEEIPASIGPVVEFVLIESTGARVLVRAVEYQSGYIASWAKEKKTLFTTEGPMDEYDRDMPALLHKGETLIAGAGSGWVIPQGTQTMRVVIKYSVGEDDQTLRYEKQVPEPEKPDSESGGI
jgi:hypothetical protein